jgi:MscS family membrane protein
MSFLSKRSLTVLFCCLLSVSAVAQLNLSQILPGTNNTPAKQNPPASTDPLGRETPNGTFFGFLHAAQLGKPDAVQYLDLSPSRRQTQGKDLSDELIAVLDAGFPPSALKSISTNPEGTAQPGVPADKERVGTVTIGESEVEVILVHRPDPSSTGKIWLFSTETLNQIPDLYEHLEAHRVETKLPDVLIRSTPLGMPAWQWLALFLAIPMAAGIAWVLLEILSLPHKMWRRRKKLPELQRLTAVSGPIWLLLGLLVDAFITKYIRIPLLHRAYYYRLCIVVLVIAVAWLTLRLLTRGLDALRNRAIARGSAGTGSLVLLGQRIIKVLVFIAAGLGIMGALGFNMTTALAGLGIGGLAIGFGAQKTIENLFGGVSLLADEVIRVGDSCNFGGRVGTVEDISLRSTRIRTVERTELSIPNGTLATMNIENLTRRDKILFNPTLGLRYETSADQLRYVLAECRRLLYEHPKVETASARIRFAGFLESTLSLEIFSYVLTRDMAEFTAIREDLFLRMMDIVTDSGTSFAFPSRTLYLGKDTGLDLEKTEQAVTQVKDWRQEKRLPFPDFAQTEISEFRDTLPYPPPDSAVNNKKW